MPTALIPPVLAALDRSSEETEAALHLLFRRADPRTAQGLLDHMDAQAENVSPTALMALGRLRYRPAAPSLRRLLDSDLYGEAAYALGEIGDLHSAAAIRARLAELDPHESADDASPLIDALRMLGDRESIPLILPFVDIPKYEAAHIAAVNALTVLDYLGAITLLLNVLPYDGLDDDILPAVRHLGAALVEPLLARPDLDFVALAELADPRAVPTLIRVLETRDSTGGIAADRAVGMAAMALARTPDSRAFEPLLRHLHRDFSPERWWTFRFIPDALGALGDPRAVVPLSFCLSSKTANKVSDSAVAALRGFGDRAIPTLLERMASEIPDEQLAAIWTVAGMKTSDPRVAARLRQIGESTSSECAIAVAARLARLCIVSTP